MAAPAMLQTTPNAGLPAGAKRRGARDAAIPAAGIIFVTKAGDGLFVKRQGGDHAGEWSIPAGKVERGEDFAQAARRESSEETGLIPGHLLPIKRAVADGVDFTTYRTDIGDRFDPILNDEASDYVWAPLNDPPNPLHPGLAKVLAEFFAEEAEEPEHKETGVAAALEKNYEGQAKDGEWNESDHPRANNGQFGSGGGSSSSYADIRIDDVYYKLANSEDVGGANKVKETAADIISQRPDLAEAVRKEASNLGYEIGITNKKDENTEEGTEEEDYKFEVPSYYSWISPETADAAEQISKEVNKFIDDGKYVGLRVIPYEDKKNYKEGSALPRSNRWVNGNITRKKLSGTSTVGLEGGSPEAVFEALHRLGALGKSGPNGYYYGSKVVLVYGDQKERGEDHGESVIDGAKVGKIWMKPDASASAVMPNSDSKDSTRIGGDCRLAFDRAQTVREFDKAGRMRVNVVNISKEQIRPYKGKEIPGWNEDTQTHALGLEKDRIYNMFCPSDELEKAAKSFEGVQLLQRHLPVNVDDHQMWDTIGTTGTECRFESPYLKNSLFVWTKGGIDYIETEERRELSSGYSYDPDMTEGEFDGKHFHGVMRNIHGNHVAIVEEGRAGHDVMVADEAMRTEEQQDMTKSTRLEFLALTTAANAINPLLAMDAEIDYGPIFKGLTSKNVRARKTTMVNDIKRAIKGKTIAKDANIEHVAKSLDQLEEVDDPESMDESVSEEQHKAMEAAAKGKSNIGIPKKVGEEFASKDKRTFGDALGDLFKKKGMDKAGFDKAMSACRDSMPENALDEEMDDDDTEAEDGENPDDPEANDDGETDEEKAKREAKEASARDKSGARDRVGARDRRGAMDKKIITQDEMLKAINAAVKDTRQQARDAAEARAFVLPFVGELPLALDSKDEIYRAAAVALRIEDAETVHPSALKTLIKNRPVAGAQPGYDRSYSDIVGDEGGSDAFDLSTMIPDASRIGSV